MKSKVYFVKAALTEDLDTIKEKTKSLLGTINLKKFIRKDDFVAIKLTFGEEENKGHINPAYVRFVVDEVKSFRGKPFLTDTNTLYKEKRQNTIDHLSLAYEHGFAPDITGAPVVIADGLRSDEGVEISINKKHFKSVKIARACVDGDSLIVLSHVTGHMMTGFAAAIKNIGMGFATRTGKLHQHSNAKPSVLTSKCNACRLCIANCPVDAIVIQGKTAYIKEDICIGCGDCLVVCREDAIKISWDETSNYMQEKMTEHALGVVKNKEGKSIFLNYAMKITRSCDCMAKDDPSIVCDIGILASADPVAIDKATADLVNEVAKSDVFKKEYPKIDWTVQLNYGAEIGLGNLEYDLIEIK
ncbi:MAG: hypothetical protein AMJ78_10200 [Omnitrophica WOR_2 bacterium SM23_29]|nr:MAG: hypothetical protein AMJ78_10200 [Omnitrophica WOR_2 bacterium SM23_29]